MIVSRSVVLNISLATFACFTLVLLQWPRDTSSVVVSISRTNAPIQRYTVRCTDTTAEDVRQRLIEETESSANNTANRTKTGWMRWRMEAADFYAKASHATPNDNHGQISTSASDNGDISLVSATEPMLPNDRSLRWFEFWQSESSRAAAWLERDQQRRTIQRESISRAITVSSLSPLDVPTASWTAASAFATVFFVAAIAWHSLAPPRLLPHSPVAAMTSMPLRKNDTPPSVLQFDLESQWFAVRQPASVRIRQAMGWFLVIATVLVSVNATWTATRNEASRVADADTSMLRGHSIDE